MMQNRKTSGSGGSLFAWKNVRIRWKNVKIRWKNERTGSPGAEKGGRDMKEKGAKRRAAAFLVLFLAIFLAAALRERSIVWTDGPAAEEGMPEWTAGHRYEQRLAVSEGGLLESVSVYLSTFWRVNQSTLSIRLLENGTELQRWQADCRRLEDSAYYELRLDKGKRIEAGNTYVLEFETDAAPGNGITAYVNRSGQGGGLSVDGVSDSGASLCYRLGYRGDGWNLYTLQALCYLPAAAFLFWRGGNVLFLWTALSLFFAISSPLFNVPDESAHFFRAFEVASGHFLSEFRQDTFEVGRALPIRDSLMPLRESWPSFWEHAGMRESEELYFCSFFNTALYSPVSYLPQAAGIALARLFTDRLVLIAYAGRLVNWLCITGMLAAALRVLPRGRAFTAFFLLLPMNLQESFSLAPDGLVTAAAVLAAALVMNLRERQQKKMGAARLALLYALAVLLAMTKIVYLPLCLLYLLIPDAAFGGRKKKVLHAVWMAALLLALSLGWLSLCGDFLVKKGADSGLQLSWLLRHPLSYALILAQTVLYYGGDWLCSMAGRELAWQDVSVPGILILLLLARLLFLLAREREAVKAAAAEREEAGQERARERDAAPLVAGLAVFFVLILTCTSLYLQWTAPYASYISGIQGRYFLPLLLLLYLALCPRPVAGAAALPGSPVNPDLPDRALLVGVNVCACLNLLLAAAPVGLS